MLSALDVVVAHGSLSLLAQVAFRRGDYLRAEKCRKAADRLMERLRRTPMAGRKHA